MWVDRQRDASASVLLSSVYFVKEVEKARHANGYGEWERGGKQGIGGKEKGVWRRRRRLEAGPKRFGRS